MEIEVKIEPGRQQPKLIILAGEENQELSRLIQQLSGLRLPGPIPVRDGEAELALPQGAFLRFYADGKGVSAQAGQQTYAVRLRLYELEQRLDQRRFVRISNSEIINLSKVTAVDLSLTGTIRMTLEGSTACFVSRRYVKKIKETLGLERRKSHEQDQS